MEEFQHLKQPLHAGQLLSLLHYTQVLAKSLL